MNDAEGLLATDRELARMLLHAADQLPDPETQNALRRHAERIDAGLSMVEAAVPESTRDGALPNARWASARPPDEPLPGDRAPADTSRPPRPFSQHAVLLSAAAVALAAVLLTVTALPRTAPSAFSSPATAASSAPRTSVRVEPPTAESAPTSTEPSTSTEPTADTSLPSSRAHPVKTSGQVSTKRTAKPEPAREPTLERRAVDAVVAGNFREAAELYAELARTRPGKKVFAVASKVLSAKAGVGIRQ